MHTAIEVRKSVWKQPGRAGSCLCRTWQQGCLSLGIFHLAFGIFRHLSFVRKSFAVLARAADRPKQGRPWVARVKAAEDTRTTATISPWVE